MSEKPSLASRSLRGSFGVLLSRLSGILRSVVLSASFGAGMALDAFFVALRIPNSLRDLLADGALSSAATTVLSEWEPGEERFLEVFHQILVASLFVTTALAIGGCLASGSIVSALVDPSYPAYGLEEAIRAFELLAFYLPIALWSALCMAVLSIKGQMIRATVASSFFNLGAIFGALVLAPILALEGGSAVQGLAWGTLLGGLAQCVFLAKPLVSAGDLRARALIAASTSAPFWTSRPVGRVFLLILPRTLGQGAVVLGMMVSTLYATGLGPGVLTYLTNTLILILVPVGLFGVAGGYAALPLLSKSRIEGRTRDFWETLDEGLLLVSSLGAFSVCALSLFALPLVVVLLEYGSFQRADSLANAGALVAFCASVWFSAQNKIQTQALYALGRTTFVAVNAFVYLGALIVGYSFLIKDFGLLGMGLATTLASALSWFVNAWALHVHARRRDDYERPLMDLSSVLFLAMALLSVGGGFFIKNAYWDAHPLKKLASFVEIALGGGLLCGFWMLLNLKWGPTALERKIRAGLSKVRRG